MNGQTDTDREQKSRHLCQQQSICSEMQTKTQEDVFKRHRHELIRFIQRNLICTRRHSCRQGLRQTRLDKLKNTDLSTCVCVFSGAAETLYGGAIPL